MDNQSHYLHHSKKMMMNYFHHNNNKQQPHTRNLNSLDDKILQSHYMMNNLYILNILTVPNKLPVHICNFCNMKDLDMLQNHMFGLSVQMNNNHHRNILEPTYNLYKLMSNNLSPCYNLHIR